MDYIKEYKEIASKFDLEGEILNIAPYGEGHINLTLLVTTDEKRYLMQKMNTNIFRDPLNLMKSICGVTEHLRARGIETLCVVPTKDGQPFCKEKNVIAYMISLKIP
jgi:N-acetylhexosamine 1-kinase